MTGLSAYKLMFVVELLVAEGSYTFRMEKRSYFPLRLLLSLAFCFGVAYFYPVNDSSYTGLYASVMFLVLFAATFCAVLFVYKISFKTSFFCAIAAYSAQHLAYELYKLILAPFDILIAKVLYGDTIINFNKIDVTTVIVALVYLEVYLVVYVAAYFFIGKKLRKGEIRLKNTSLLILAAVILLVDVILNAAIVYISTDYNKIYDVIVGIYNSLCCILVFYIQRSIIEVRDIRDELETVSHLLQQAQKQYQMKKEEIDLINIKCHDLKHQIGEYARGGGLDGETVAEIRQLVSIYDAAVSTGNKVLDIILTEKSLACRSKNIKLTCMADCTDLNFITDGELYALFGNLFDNAIEAASRVTDSEYRCISVNVHKEGGFYSITEENYYAGEIEFDATGLPVTRKPNKDYHGFGVRSMKVIAEKYGGAISIAAEDNVFRLNVLIPIVEK